MLWVAASSRAWAAAAAALVNRVVVLVVLLQAAVVLPVWSCAGACAFGPACSVVLLISFAFVIAL
jgi:hypothetical protein